MTQNEIREDLSFIAAVAVVSGAITREAGADEWEEGGQSYNTGGIVRNLSAAAVDYNGWSGAVNRGESGGSGGGISHRNRVAESGFS